MASLLKRVRNSDRRAPLLLHLCVFQRPALVNVSEMLEEEQFPNFKTEHYYQVLGKLGLRLHACTIWLARVTQYVRVTHVTLKVYTRDDDNQEELERYMQLNWGNLSHLGSVYVRKELDIFSIPGAGGNHHCLVQKPMWGPRRSQPNSSIHRRPPQGGSHAVLFCARLPTCRMQLSS